MKRRDLMDLAEPGAPSGGRLARAFGRNKYLWYAFAFPVLLIWLAYLTRGIFPIANRCILTIDLYHQYAPFLSELREKLTGFESLLYTWNAGLGINFLALSAYYLISPFNLLLLAFPSANLPEAIAFIQIVKIGLCSFTMAYYLRKRFGTDGIGLMLFGTFYALSAYVLAYSWNIMWLDGVLMLPIIALGLEEMIAGRGFKRYTLALAATILFCYYIAYFICLFLVIYFLVAYFSRHPALRFGLFFRKGLKFVFFSLLAGGMAAIIVLPTYTALQLTSAANDVFPSEWKLSFTLFEFLTNHLAAVPQYIRSGLPNIYSGLFVLILVPLYFFSPSIPTRSKVAYIFGLLAVYFSFNLNMLDFIWNGMHYPNQLPYRYAFVYVFLILGMAYPAFARIREHPPRLLAGIAMGAAFFVLLAEQLKSEAADTLTVYVSIVFLALIAAAFVYARNTSRPKEVRVTILTSVLIAELVFNTFVTVDLMDRTEYYSDRAGFVADRTEVIDLMDELEREEPDTFYRMELLDARTVNDTILHSYRGVSIFASTAYLETTQIMDGLGLHNNGINSYKYHDNTPVLESILGIRYLVGKDASYARSHLEAVRTDGDYSIYRNPYALPLGFMAGTDLDQWAINRANPFDVQNRFVELTAGVSGVLDDVDLSVAEALGVTASVSGDNSVNYSNASSTSSVTLLLDTGDTRDVYFFVDASQLGSVEYAIGDGEDAFRKTVDLKRPYIVDIGTIQKGTPVTLKITLGENTTGRFPVYAAALNDDRYVEAMSILAEQGLAVDAVGDTFVSGTVDVETAGTLFTTIPYDVGWTVRVDGQTTATYAIAEGLLGLDLEQGTHRVELTYRPPRLREGALISASSVVVFAVVWLILHLLTRRRPPDEPLSGHWPPVPEDAHADILDAAQARVQSIRAPDDAETDRDASIRIARHLDPGRIRTVELPSKNALTDEDSGLPPQLPHHPADARFLPPDEAVLEPDDDGEENESVDPGTDPTDSVVTDDEQDVSRADSSGEGFDGIEEGGVGEDLPTDEPDDEDEEQRRE